MAVFRDIPWSRIFAEGTVIVASILLAFWIDAWWQGRVESKDAESLARGLRSDFTTSQSHLEEWLAGNQRALNAASDFLAGIRRTPVGEELAVSQEWLVAAVAAPTYDPTDTTLRTAVSTGRIDLIADQALRNALAIWRQQLEDTQEDERLVRQIVVGQLVPVLSQQVRLGEAFEFDPMISWFTGRRPVEFSGGSRIRVTGELEAALAQKVFYMHFVVEGLAAIDEIQGQILQHLDGRL